MTENLSSPTTTDALVERAAALRAELEARIKAAQKVQKLLDPVKKTGELPRGAALAKLIAELERHDLADETLDERRRELGEALTRHAEAQSARARMQFLGELKAAVEREGVEFVRLTDSPPTVYLHPITVAIDFDAERASLSYARDALGIDSPLEVEPLLAARQAAMDTIKDQAIDSAEFFDLLRQAYAMVLIARGEQPGERVDLVDLLVPLSVLRVDRRQWRRRGLGAMSDYPRYLLSYQLQRLRRDGMLERDGVRLDLGTATGGSTKDKRNVIFIPTSPTDGQYYLSLRFG